MAFPISLFISWSMRGWKCTLTDNTNGLSEGHNSGSTSLYSSADHWGGENVPELVYKQPKSRSQLRVKHIAAGKSLNIKPTTDNCCASIWHSQLYFSHARPWSPQEKEDRMDKVKLYPSMHPDQNNRNMLMHWFFRHKYGWQFYSSREKVQCLTCLRAAGCMSIYNKSKWKFLWKVLSMNWKEASFSFGFATHNMIGQTAIFVYDQARIATLGSEQDANSHTFCKYILNSLPTYRS